MPKPRVKVPKSATAGELVTIKTLIDHPMESGQRKDADGNKIPQMIIHTFEATFNGEPVIKADLKSAISTNPYVQFQFTVPETGELAFRWEDEEGSVFETAKTITVA